jgi:hypothetical protein
MTGSCCFRAECISFGGRGSPALLSRSTPEGVGNKAALEEIPEKISVIVGLFGNCGELAKKISVNSFKIG